MSTQAQNLVRRGCRLREMRQIVFSAGENHGISQDFDYLNGACSASEFHAEIQTLAGTMMAHQDAWRVFLPLSPERTGEWSLSHGSLCSFRYEY